MDENYGDMSARLAKVVDSLDGRTALRESEVKNFLSALGIAVPTGIYLPGGENSLPTNLHYPLVAKVSSSQIASKSELGGVRVGIGSADELADAVKALRSIEKAEGLLIEEMAPTGTEVIVGGVMDSQFGPVVMFGLGGVFVELFKDVSFGLAPMNKEEALAMVREVKGFRLLDGYRGRPKADIDALLNIVSTVSRIMATGMVEEIDLNPVTLYPSGAMVLDAKMALRKNG